MKTHDKFRELQHNMGWLMKTLRPYPDGGYTATVHFGSYTLMAGFVADLMRVCALIQEDGDSIGVGPLDSRRVSVVGLMEVAVQLLPIDECEFLDEARILLAETPADSGTDSGDVTEDVTNEECYFLNPPLPGTPTEA